MNITRTISEQVAEKMVAPIVAKIKSLSDERQIISEEAIQNSLPKDLKDCFKKHRSCFQKSSCATLYSGKHEIRIEKLSYFPASSSWYPHIEVGSQVIEHLDKLRIKIDKLNDEKEKTYNSIVSALLSLRTFKRAKEQFPDAYEYLKEYEEPGKTAVSLPIEDILSTIKKYK